MSLLQAQFDVVRYGSVPVLRGVAISVEPGEIVAILGRNGAGKTTLLRALSGVMVRSKGSVRFRNESMAELPPHQRVRLGLAHVPEGRRVFGELTVEENLRIGAFARRKELGRTWQSGFSIVYETFPVLRERASQAAASLSGGEQQMLAIGRALMAQPALVMIDEASLGLSPILVSRVMDALAGVSRLGTAVILVEQNVHASLAIAARAYVLRRGTIALSGTAGEVAASQELTEAYLGDESEKPAAWK
jgi:branched-chain amino acid transport system ATP-binding protein